MKCIKLFESYNKDRDLIIDYLKGLDRVEGLYPYFGVEIKKIIYVDKETDPIITIDMDRILSNKRVKRPRPQAYIDHTKLDFLTSMVDMSEEHVLIILKQFIEQDINSEIEEKILLSF